MESLSATVDARDSYTAGHSRRVQQLALAIGRELGLSQAELDLLGHAALFHDIGKLAIPDAILLKPASLTTEEWALMQRHAEEGARIIDRLGFLDDAVPAIRHHHERFDGTRLPGPADGRGDPARRADHPRRRRARLDAHDPHLPRRRGPPRRRSPSSGGLPASQFCPRCVAALERILPIESLEDARPPSRPSCSPAASLRLGRRLHRALLRSWSVCSTILAWPGSRRSAPSTAIDPDGSRRSRPGSASATATSSSSTSCARAPSASAARRRCGSSRTTPRRASIRRR